MTSSDGYVVWPVRSPTKITSPEWSSAHGWCWTSLMSPIASGTSKQSPTARSPAFPESWSRKIQNPPAIAAMMPIRSKIEPTCPSRSDPSDPSDHDGPILPVEIVPRLRRDSVEVLTPRTFRDLEPDRPVEPQRDAVPRPRHGLDQRPAVGARIVEEVLVERGAEAMASNVRVRRDHVAVGRVGMVR